MIKFIATWFYYIICAALILGAAAVYGLGRHDANKAAIIKSQTKTIKVTRKKDEVRKQVDSLDDRAVIDELCKYWVRNGCTDL